ncbi:winged helix-turn-helix domain-containing protein [Neobacillus mesonae]|nr:winged helix-turn-helix domain-containing protein [Neobacillus mesonae]
MSINPDISTLVSLLGEPSRAAILTSLMDGRFHTAGELAYMAAIKPQTASFHLAKLTEANLVEADKQGRHRYYRLANGEVAKMLEFLFSVSPPPEVRSLKQSGQVKQLRNARTCYDHLAGKLGVDLTKAMQDSGYLIRHDKEFEVTAEGERFFTALGLNLDEYKKKRRSFCHACLDWSEREYHLGGALGNGLLKRLLELGWIVQAPSIRAVKVTGSGIKELHRHFNIVFELS